MSQKQERPKYIIKVHRDWRYGPRARFWDIMEWTEFPKHPKRGWWSSVAHGLSYSKWGMRLAINRKLKKMQFGIKNEYFNLDGSVFKDIK